MGRALLLCVGMNAETSRYTRITHRLALGASAEDDEESQALAELLHRRILESIAIESAPHVTSGLLSQRLAQAVAALSEHGIVLRVTDAGIQVERCFCELHACDHPRALLERLLGVSIESIIVNKDQRALQLLGAVES